jgi:hypothetical protein
MDEAPDLPSLKCSSHCSLGLFPASVARRIVPSHITYVQARKRDALMLLYLKQNNEHVLDFRRGFFLYRLKVQSFRGRANLLLGSVRGVTVRQCAQTVTPKGFAWNCGSSREGQKKRATSARIDLNRRLLACSVDFVTPSIWRVKSALVRTRE